MFRLAASLPPLFAASAALAQTTSPTPPPTSLLPPAVVAPAPAPPPPPPPVPIPALTPAQAATLSAWLATGADHGVASPGAGAQALSGDALIAAVLDRARALHAGRLAPEDFLDIWAMRPVAYDPRPDFAAAVAADRLPQWIASLTPPYAGYDGLRRGLAAYRAMQAAGGWAAIPPGPDLRIGAGGARVAALRARLRFEDDDVAPSGSYDLALAEAVQRAQRRFGMNPTGTVNAATLAQLNVPVAARIDSIIANMERWRWLPRTLPTHRVQVNIAAAVLTVFEGDRPVYSMRAVTGRPDAATPMLESKIHSIVINPPWNVPTGIAQRELFPKGAAYLAAHGFRVIETPEGGKRLQQAAGASSALGRFKFDFANKFSVYLHDTPSQSTFASFDRLASHGCVRLEKPRDLAALMLKDDPNWQLPAIDAAVATAKTQRVPLTDQVSVYLLYWTAFAGANGVMNFRDDPYKWDRLLATKVAAAADRATRAPVIMGMN